MREFALFLFSCLFLMACTADLAQRETAVPDAPTVLTLPSSSTSIATPPSAEATIFLPRSCPQIDATTGTEIVVEPCPGDYLDYGASSPAIVLEEITVETSTCEQDYHGAPLAIRTVKAGDPCFLIRGRIKNEHNEEYYVGLWASGYNSAEIKVSWTLDAAHIAGAALVSVGDQAVQDFALHLNFAHDVKFIEIRGEAYNFPPP